LIPFVKQQVSGSLAFLHRQCRERLILPMKLHHAGQINCAEYIDVMQKERLFRMARVFEKEPRCFLEAAAGVEQNVFARNFNSHLKVVVLLQISNNHVGKVMHVDDHFANPVGAQATKRNL
jgi:hypothetical protein